MMADLIVRGSIWLALACFLTAHVAFGRSNAKVPARWAHAVYWMGASLAFAHYLAAFHWHYNWSHTRAVAVTAGQTAQVFGLDWGGGVWVNYLFLAVWLADAAWRTTRGGVQVSAGTWVLRGFYLIVIANGAITFAEWPMQLAGSAVVAGLVWSWRPQAPRRARSRRHSSSSSWG